MGAVPPMNIEMLHGFARFCNGSIRYIGPEIVIRTDKHPSVFFCHGRYQRVRGTERQSFPSQVDFVSLGPKKASDGIRHIFI